MTILLTGGAGFIGSCLLKKLNDKGYRDIIISDNLGSGLKWRNLNGKHFSRYIDKYELLSALSEDFSWRTKKPDVIIHLGACTSTTETDADYLMENNFNFSVSLAHFAAENNIRFIYASSAATYGAGEYGYSENHFDELEPLNPYGFSKHVFDKWVIQNGLISDFTGLKFFNVFGPNEYHKASMASMVYKSYHQVKDTQCIRLFKSYHPDYKDGEQKRDFIYVKDVIDVIYKIMEDKDINGIYNLGTGVARSWNDLANAVFIAMGVKPSIEYIEMPEELIGQYQYFTEADMANFAKTSAYSGFTPLEDAVADYIQNYLMSNKIYL